MIVLSHVLKVLDLLDRPDASGSLVAEHLYALGAEPSTITVDQVVGDLGSTDFISITIAGSRGRIAGGHAPTLGVVGRLGGIGARPELIGYVSDGDGATAALATAAKLISMNARGDVLPGDVVVSTHICPDAPTRPHHPVPFMDSPVDIYTMNEHEVTAEMDAVLSIDTTKGNRLINHRGVAISPTVKAGYILPASDDLVAVMETVSGLPAVVFPLSTQDITPYGNGLHHLNSILQPAVATSAPVVGVAITTVTAVAGCATGASHEVDIALAARFSVEVAKGFTSGSLTFYDEAEAALLESLYGPATHLQTTGEPVPAQA